MGEAEAAVLALPVFDELGLGRQDPLDVALIDSSSLLTRKDTPLSVYTQSVTLPQNSASNSASIGPARAVIRATEQSSLPGRTI